MIARNNIDSSLVTIGGEKMGDSMMIYVVCDMMVDIHIIYADFGGIEPSNRAFLLDFSILKPRIILYTLNKLPFIAFCFRPSLHSNHNETNIYHEYTPLYRNAGNNIVTNLLLD